MVLVWLLSYVYYILIFSICTYNNDIKVIFFPLNDGIDEFIKENAALTLRRIKFLKGSGQFIAV